MFFVILGFLFDGTVEQNYIAHVMAYSACIGPYNATNYPDCQRKRGALVQVQPNGILNSNLVFFIELN